MGVQLGKTSGLPITGNIKDEATRGKSKSNQDFLLCLALIVLMGWAFLLSVHAVEWASISHAVKSLLTAVW